MLIVKDRFTGISEPEVKTYIDAVEAADGELIEFGVANAVNEFVRGCKNDNIWEAIKASCILAGARTLGGALVPLTGTAPTNNNFVSADYNRKTGLIGNGHEGSGNKIINSNRAHTADPKGNRHIAVYRTQTTFPGNSQVLFQGGEFYSSYTRMVHNQNNLYTEAFVTKSLFVGGSVNLTLGNYSGSHLIGLARPDESTVIARRGNFSTTYSNTPVSSGSNSTSYTFGPTGGDYRLKFYSIGEFLDLTKLDTRVTTLMNTFSSVIP